MQNTHINNGKVILNKPSPKGWTSITGAIRLEKGKVIVAGTPDTMPDNFSIIVEIPFSDIKSIDMSS